MNAARRCALYQALQSLDPHPTTELEYQTPFELLIAVMLSAPATDVSVNKATRILFARANTPRALLELGADGLRPYIQSIGLYRTKARNIIAACAMLLERYQGQVPRSAPRWNPCLAWDAKRRTWSSTRRLASP